MKKVPYTIPREANGHKLISRTHRFDETFHEALGILAKQEEKRRGRRIGRMALLYNLAGDTDSRIIKSLRTRLSDIMKELDRKKTDDHEYSSKTPEGRIKAEFS